MKSLLAECAWAATRSKNTYYQAKYYAMAQRKGKKKALLVIGHKILCAAYILLKTGLPYQEFGVERFEKQRKEKRIAYLKKELKDLEVAA